MKAVNIVKALGPIDAKSVGRDAFLRWIIVLPLIIALAARWVIPSLALRLTEILGLDLMPVYPALMGYILLLLVPLLVGTVIGFLLLDQRDDQTLMALLVTPLSLNGYLVYRLALPLLLSWLVTLVIFPVAGLVKIGFLSLLITTLGAALQAPLFALFLAAFAENKVQGFALVKAASVVLFPPLVAYFVRSDWQWLFGVFPTYWPARLFWLVHAGEPGVWITLLVGLGYHCLLLAVLVRRFNNVVTRY